MDRLINELTFYSKIDTNRIPYTFSKINVREYFDDCVEDIGLELSQQQIHLTYVNDVARDVLVIADAEQMKRVINNIVGNSIKYMDKPEPFIRIRVLMWGILFRWRSKTMAKALPPETFPISLTASTAPTLPEILPKAEAALDYPSSTRSWRTTEARCG